MGFKDRLMHAWNAFARPDLQTNNQFDYGSTSFGDRPYGQRSTFNNERSIISSIYNRIAVDVAAVDIRHVRVDKDGRYLDDISSGLNDCLTVEANIDQAATALRQDRPEDRTGVTAR